MAVIKNIIFDLGGVLLDIDYQKTIDAFKKLQIENFEEMFSQCKADELFEKLETGNVKEPDFYAAIKSKTKAKISNAQIESAWNAMILDFRMDSLFSLERLSEKYTLFLLSNTNIIHLKYFNQLFTRQTGKPLLDQYFTKAWYSNQIGLRKPYPAVFDFVLKDAELVAEETLFIDDTLLNVEAAQKMRLKTHHLLPGEKIEMLNL